MAEGADLDQDLYRSATLVGFMAILMWSLLAALTVATGAVPPFQLAAVCFAIGGALGLIWTGIRGELGLLTGQPLSVWLHGVGGIFGYHFFLLHSATSRLTSGSQPYRLSLAVADRIILCGVTGPPIEGTPRCRCCVGARRCGCNRTWPGQGANHHRASRLSGCGCLRTHLVCLLGQQSNFFKSVYQSCHRVLPGQQYSGWYLSLVVRADPVAADSTRLVGGAGAGGGAGRSGIFCLGLWLQAGRSSGSWCWRLSGAAFIHRGLTGSGTGVTPAIDHPRRLFDHRRRDDCRA